MLVKLEDDEYKARVAQEQGLLDNAKARLAELKAGSRPQEIAQAKSAVAIGRACAERWKMQHGTHYERVALGEDFAGHDLGTGRPG